MEPRTSVLVILIALVPLAAAALMPLAGALIKGRARWLVLAASLASLTLACVLIPEVFNGGSYTYTPGGAASLGIELRLDLLGLLFCLLIGGLASLVAIYGFRFIGHELPGREVQYLTAFMLLVTGLQGLAIAGDLLTFWIFMEVMALSAYILIAIMRTPHAFEASLRYLLMGTLSSLAILGGIALLYYSAGTLNMAGVLAAAPGAARGPAALALVLCAAGFCVKGAQVPVHFWLPGAHSTAVTPISAMHSGLVAKVGFFGLARFIFFAFGSASALGVTSLTSILCWIGAASIIYGGVMAALEDDLKLILAYSTVSHIGFMVLGLGLLSRSGMTGAVFHLLDDGIAKACLFLCAGVFIYRSGTRQVKELRGAARELPLTAAMFTLAAFSLVGIPPTSGFISKWYLVLGSLEAQRPFFVAVILVGALLAAFYTFRVVYYLYFAAEREGTLRWDNVPAGMLIPIAVLGTGTWALGIASSLILPSIQRFVGQLLP
ncbi:MAG: complex I subunit 5 family protein [Candidatus Geothermincolia bacterium]